MEGGVQPVMDIGGNGDCNGGWGNGAWGGLFGGAVGGAIGSAWGNNRNGNNGCCNNGCGDQYIMDSLTTMRSDVNSIGRDQLIQTTQLGQGICQGFGGINAGIERLGATLGQGQCRTEAAVLTTGLNGQIQQKDNTIFQLNASHAAEVQSMRNAYELKGSIDACCCATNANIERQGSQTREVLLSEGCATRAAIDRQGNETRALIAQLDRERLLRESAAKDAKIAQLEAQSFNSALAAGTAQQTRNDMNAMMTNIIGHMAVINRSGNTGTTGQQAA